MKTKRAIIYDKWFDTLGGGEVVVCNMAQILLEKGFHVQIVVGTLISTSEIFNKIKIDLSKCEFIQIWNDELRLQELTKKSDLFINITFMDYSIGLAKKNIYYAHFPTPEYSGLKSFILNLVLFPIIYRYTKPIEILNHNPPELINHRLGYKIDPQCTVAFANQKINQVVECKFFIFYEEFTKKGHEDLKVNIRNTTILDKKVTVDLSHNIVKYTYTIKPSSNTIYLEIKGNTKSYLVEPISRPRSRYQLLNKFSSNWQAKARIGMFKNVSKRLETYDLIICHSNFVKEWISKIWHKKAVVLYPPVDLINNSNYQNKKNIIVSVGRFFTKGHGKKQDVMIKAFRQVFKKNPTWQLHLIGGASGDQQTQDYLSYLQQESKDLPVFFHLNISRLEVEKSLLESKIYWHAGGYQESDPIKMEHFGIAPVEGISAGCVPILYKNGGLPEIIEKIKLDPSKHLFEDIDELVAKTNEWIKNPKPLSKKAIELCKLFDYEKFKRDFSKVIL